MKYIGLSTIDWNSVIDSIKDQRGIVIGKVDEIFNEDGDSRDTRLEHVEQTARLKLAGYNLMDSIEWSNYKPGKHFDSNVVAEFDKFVNCKSLAVWISSIRPGKCIPYHWDFDYGEFDAEVVANRNKLVRYTCHISKPEFGHIFATENQCFYNEQQGNTYQWDHLDLYHGGSNFGLVPKYLFNYVGYPL